MDSEKQPCGSRRIIELKDVSLCYGSDCIMRHVNLVVDRGDFMAVSGPNGGGKTTLMRLILRLLRPTEGEVCYFNESGTPVKRLSIGYLPQKSAVDLRFPITVRRMVLSGLIQGWGLKMPADAADRLARVDALLGLGTYMDRPIGAVSGGQLQRALLARAIISEPELVVLDEPLSYVDKHFENQIYSIVADLAKKSTIILVSHEMTVISRLSNRHIIVNRGVELCPSHHHGPQSPFCP